MQFIKKHLKSEFLRNVLTLFSGASVAQFIPILVSPILSRMYAPEQFGELGVIMSVVGIFSIMATFQYSSAIMLPKKDEDAFNILTLAVVITVFISLLSYVITNVFSEQIADILKAPAFPEWAFIIPFFVFLTGLYSSLNIWTSRKKQFKRLAFRQIAQTTVGSGTKLTFGWLKYTNIGLIWGAFAGQFTSTGALAIMTLRDSKYLIPSISIERIKKNAIEYQDFPKYTMWQGFFDLVNSSGVVFILSSFYGAAVVGLYSFSLGLLMKPSRLIGQAVSQVFYQKASKKVANGESIYNDTIRMVRNLALIGGLMFLPILITGPYLFSFVYGDKWWDAGVIAQIISFSLFFRFIASPMASIAVIKKKQKEFLFITTGMNLLFPALFLITGLLSFDYKYAFMASTAFMVVYFIATISWVLKISKN